MGEPILCVDVGSTFTKAVLVDGASGKVLATAAHPTTISTDVLDGVAAVRHSVESTARAAARDVLACSSAGGGLRLAVVGYERVVTGEAGYRVALSAGGRVVHVHAGLLDDAGLDDVREARPDVILLVGGTDGGNSEVLLHNAGRLAAARIAVPVVVAGNAAAADEARSLLERTKRKVSVAPNVLPRIGVLDPLGARSALREVFLKHVIGGKHLSKGPAFGRMVRGATPDVVLAGIEILADGAGRVPGVGDVIVVDVGGATTDVYSVLTPSGDDATVAREVVAMLWRARTVEGDLGMRWSAPSVVSAAVQERLVEPVRESELSEYAARVAAHPGDLPSTAREREDEVDLARLAVMVALRRHGRPPTPSAGPRPLRDVGLVIGSGGVLRHADPAERARILAPVVSDHAGGWPVPEGARVAVDRQYVLFAAGLLAERSPEVAARLAMSIVDPPV